MKKWIKRILIGMVVLVLVAVVGVALFLLTFDPNAYKYKLEELIQARYDRSLTIDGDIELSLFPRIGLAVQGVSLSEAGSDEVFASVDSARVAVAVWPLLSNSLVVDHVTISGFTARVVRDKQGHFNFENLTGSQDVSPDVRQGSAGRTAAGAVAAGAQRGVKAITDVSERVSRADMQIDIAGLDLKEGELFLQDEISGMALRVSQLNALTGRVTFKQPFDFNVSARIEGGNPRVDAKATGQALLTLDPAAMKYAAQKFNLRLEGVLPSAHAKSLTALGNVAYDGQSDSLNVAGLELAFQGDIDAQPPLRGVDATIAVPSLVAKPEGGQLKVEKLTVRAKGGREDGTFDLALDAPALDITGAAAKGEPVTGRLRLGGAATLDAGFALAGIGGNGQALQIEALKFDATHQRGPRATKFALASPLSLSLTHRNMELADIKGQLQIADPALPGGAMQIPLAGRFSADLAKDAAAAQLHALLDGGAFALDAKASRLADTPQVAFTLAADVLDLDKLLPPLPAIAKAPAGGQPATGAAEPKARPAVPEPEFDFSALTAASATGSVKIGKLVARGVQANDVAATVKLQDGRLELTGIKAALYEGGLTGSLFLDAARGNQLGTRLSLAGISVQPLLADALRRDLLSGRGSLALDLKTAGNTVQAWRRGLDGTMQLRLTDGAIKGIDIARTLRELKVTVQGEREPVAAGPRQTDFSRFNADIAFAKGIGTVRNMGLDAPLLRITQGEPATINLISDTLDLVVKVRVVNTATGQHGKALADLKDISIPVHIVGPFEKPLYSVQWAGIGSDALRRTLENRLIDALSGAKGEPDPAAPGGQAKAAMDAKEEAKKTVEDLGKALKGLFSR